MPDRENQKDKLFRKKILMRSTTKIYDIYSLYVNIC